MEIGANMTNGGRPLSERAREEIVRNHIDAENRHDIAAVIALFERVRYELISTGEVIEGAAGVEAMYRELFTAVPDVAFEILSVDHQESSTIIRFEMTGTDSGGYRGAVPTGRPLKIGVIAQFLFGEESLVCKRIYALDEGPDPDGHLTRLGNTISLSAARRHRRKPTT